MCFNISISFPKLLVFYRDNYGAAGPKRDQLKERLSKIEGLSFAINRSVDDSGTKRYKKFVSSVRELDLSPLPEAAYNILSERLGCGSPPL
jgi:hypothetical protein